MNYYNENDRQAAAWLRELITAGVISEGVVDERSIVEVTPRDLKGFVQCHFFAGIGGWSYALRLAGWPDDREVWTASLPCQPWSTSGKRLGEADSRHLWPTFRELVAKRKPPALFGEQVASALGRLWLARVRSDLEDLGNEVGAADLCAAGIRAPHRRQRLFWVGYAKSRGRRKRGDASRPGSVGHLERAGGTGLGRLADTGSDRRDLQRGESGEPEEARKSGQWYQFDPSRALRWLADADRDGRTARERDAGRQEHDAQHRGGLDNAVRGRRRSRAGQIQTARDAARGPSGHGRVGDTEGQGRAGSEHARTSGQEESDGAWVLGAGGSGSASDWSAVARAACRLGDALRAGLSPSKQKAMVRARRRDKGRATGKPGRASDRLADAASPSGPQHEREPRQGARRPSSAPNGADRGGIGRWMDDTTGSRTRESATSEPKGNRPDDRLPQPTGPWDDYDLIPCRDGKARRVESGTFPLAHGLPGRVGLLRGYGNAIVPQVAAEFIQACEEARAH